MKRYESTHVSESQGVLRDQLLPNLEHHVFRELPVRLVLEDAGLGSEGPHRVIKRRHVEHLHLGESLHDPLNRLRKRCLQATDHATFLGELREERLIPRPQPIEAP